MAALVPASRSWLTRPRTVGTPLHWASNGALVGASVPFGLLFTMAGSMAMAGEWATFAMFFRPWLGSAFAAAAIGGVVGGVVGLGQPALLDRLRGRVSLPTVILVQCAIGAASVAVVVVGPLVIAGGQFLSVLTLLVAVGGMTMLLGWLPFTVATVLRRRAWPIAIAAGLSAPVVVWNLFRLFWTLFL